MEFGEEISTNAYITKGKAITLFEELSTRIPERLEFIIL